MPGHIIEAACACGFSKELLPGLNDNERFAEYGMYTESGADLDIFEQPEIARRKLNELSDPFLEELDAEFSSEELDALLKRRTEPQGPYHCPQCQQKSLFLHFQGHWD
jgi:hypothetical protein